VKSEDCIRAAKVHKEEAFRCQSQAKQVRSRQREKEKQLYSKKAERMDMQHRLGNCY